MNPATAFVGFFAAIGLYNALLYGVTRDRPFAWYAAAMFSMIVLQAQFPPYAAILSIRLGPDGMAIYRIVALVGYYVCLVGFTRSFLEVPRRFPAIDRWIVGLLLANLAAILVQNRLPDSLAHDVLDETLNFGLLAACMAAGIATARNGANSARYFTVAFAGAVIGVFIDDLNGRFGWSPWLAYALQAGIAWEALFLALALANRLQFAVVDQLTGIANRRALEAALERSWWQARRAGAPLAILMADIDDFKRYNDSYGHPAGDELLRDVARAARAVCRSGIDTFARYGGEEFIAVLPGGDPRTAAAMAERMRADVERLTPATISIGFAMTLPDDGSPAKAIARADAALYVAKHAGKNRTAADPATCAAVVDPTRSS